MSIVLYHHPYSRAANVLWMLEETGVPYALHPVDIMKGAQKAPDILALNPMGKLPILVDGSVVVTESAAIGLYLADCYAPGRLAPALDDPARASFLRWSFFAPSVIEPGAMAHASGWNFRPAAAGFGTYEDMLATMEAALAHGPWLLDARFTMADVIFGGTLRYMLQFNMLEPRPLYTAYVQRLDERPAYQRANAKNTAIARELGLGH
ncbi:glutathione S-transferase family protein [Hylemonella gracilis]|uniref:Glutathione S-transferase family protein n=1 Tax=Hylemonella gracilis TaxID=80880 RepID=A0A4V1A213_9BURK|nr:glutathione S-transferase family protein [Hylemonella gracilis]QBK04449.1 glutathione S-transferase family protein [Hylemonella gracilis]